MVDFFDLPINSQYLSIVKSQVNKIVTKSKWLNAISVEVTQDKIININTKDLKQGIYIVSIYDGKNSYQKKKKRV